VAVLGKAERGCHENAVAGLRRLQSGFPAQAVIEIHQRLAGEAFVGDPRPGIEVKARPDHSQHRDRLPVQLFRSLQITGL